MQDAIYALALLKTNWELHRRSYIDNFNFLTAECLKYSEHDVVSVQELAGSLRDRFGLKLPLNVVETLLKRAVRQKWLRREHGIYRVDRAEVNTVDLASTQLRAMEAQEQLITDLCSYADRTFAVKWTRPDAERAIFTYLGDEALTFLRAASKRTYVPLPKRSTKSEKYIFANYVNGLVDTNSPLFDKLRTVAEGNMLVNGIFLPEGAGEAAKKFDSTKLFFDTRFILSALGYTGSSLRAANEELLTLAHKAGAGTCCFAHTRDEVAAILRGCARSLSAVSGPPGYGPVYDYFLARRKSETDVLLYAGRVDIDLQEIGLSQETAPERKNEFVLDEVKLEQCIRDKVNYINDYALVRDIASVSSVIQLRGNSQPRYLETSKAVFVTPNRALVEAVVAFFEVDEPKDDRVSIAITDGDLANLLWLKQPLVAPELPRKRLIATFYAAVQPSEEFRRRYLAEIEKLEQSGRYDEKDVFLLRHSLEARRIAMDLTVGDESAFAMGTITDVLEILEEHIRREAFEQAELERGRAQAIDRSLRELQSQREAEQNAVAQRRSLRLARIHAVAAAVAWGIYAITAATFAIALYLAVPEVPLAETMPSWLRIIAGITAAVVTLTTWLVPVAPVASIREKTESVLRRGVKRIADWLTVE